MTLLLARELGRQAPAARGEDSFEGLRAAWAKKTGVIFRSPATGIRLSKRDLPIWQPVDPPGQLAGAAAAATTPQARVCVVLAAIHAARPGAISALRLDDIDLASSVYAWPTPTGRWAS